MRGFLRVGGCQKKAFHFEAKHPTICPKAALFTHLIVSYFHVKCSHSGLNCTLATSCQRYWVIGATATLRQKKLVQSILPKDSKACKAADRRVFKLLFEAWFLTHRGCSSGICWTGEWQQWNMFSAELNQIFVKIRASRSVFDCWRQLSVSENLGLLITSLHLMKCCSMSRFDSFSEYSIFNGVVQRGPIDNSCAFQSKYERRTINRRTRYLV